MTEPTLTPSKLWKRMTADQRLKAARVLVIYHLADHRGMMGAFLDALGIAHENGLIQDDGAKPDPEKIQPAVAALNEKFAPDDVSLYLQTLVCQDPDTWGALRESVAIETA